MGEMPATPELEKVAAVSGVSQQLGEFVDWLRGEGVQFMRHGPVELESGRSTEALYPDHRSTHTLLADFFRIDLAKCDAERRALLAYVRNEATQ